MPFTVTMPKLSPTMEEGTIVKWHKKEGEFVPSGELLMEVATDKATIEYQALDEGWLRKVLVKQGGVAVINQPLAILTVEENESLEGYQPENIEETVAETEMKERSSGEGNENEEGEKLQSSRKDERISVQPKFIPEPPLENYHFEYPTERLEKRILASPLARTIAAEKNLDLSSVKGTGPNQRVIRRDLEKAQPKGTMAFGKREVPEIPPGTYEKLSLSPIRKVIGQRLQEAKSFIPHFYVSQVVDPEPLIIIREQLKDGGVKVSVNDFIVKAVALALRKHGAVNSGFDSVDQSIVLFKTVDIAVAVSVEGGLITPIIRHADYKNLGEISVETKHLAQKAREGKLTPEEYKGGSFTISNLGMYGISEFQAILNPPQAAILAVGGIQDVPVIKEGNVVPGKSLHLSLSVDHRVIDGVEAALFLKSLKKMIEQPAQLLL